MHGDPYEIRTRVAGVRGRSLRPLDQRAVFWCNINFVPAIRFFKRERFRRFSAASSDIPKLCTPGKIWCTISSDSAKASSGRFCCPKSLPAIRFLSGSGSSGFQPPTRTFRNCAHRERFGAPSGTRTRDTLIKSQVLYQLS